MIKLAVYVQKFRRNQVYGSETVRESGNLWKLEGSDLIERIQRVIKRLNKRPRLTMYINR